MFNTLLDVEIWDNCKKPSLLYFSLNTWIPFTAMSDQEKMDHPKAFVCDGYLRTLGYKEAFQESFKSATKEDIALLKALPNFNAEVFYEISGIRV